MRVLDEYLGDDFRGIIGTGIDVPTLRHFGRRPDVVYLAPEHVSPQDWERGYPAHAPDLVVEVLSKGDEARDTREKRREYALVGVPHYWIVDPVARTVHILVLSGDGEYHSDRVLTLDDELTSPLFPGLSVPVRRLFPGP